MGAGNPIVQSGYHWEEERLPLREKITSTWKGVVIYTAA